MDENDELDELMDEVNEEFADEENKKQEEEEEEKIDTFYNADSYGQTFHQKASASQGTKNNIVGNEQTFKHKSI